MVIKVIGIKRLNELLEFYSKVHNMVAVHVSSKLILENGKVERLYTIYF